jgi:hypothetical protein
MPLPEVASSHNPGGWRGFTLGPPISVFNNPLLLSKISLTNSAEKRARGEYDK